MAIFSALRTLIIIFPLLSIFYLIPEGSGNDSAEEDDEEDLDEEGCPREDTTEELRDATGTDASTSCDIDDRAVEVKKLFFIQ